MGPVKVRIIENQL